MNIEPLAKSSWLPQDIFKTISSVFIGASTASFILGLLVVNLHLAQYGIYSKEFLRTEYILTGASFVLIIVMAEVGLSKFIDWTGDVVSLWHEKKFRQMLWSPLKFALPVVAIPAVLTFLRGEEIFNGRSFGLALFSVFVASNLFNMAYRYLKRHFYETSGANDNTTQVDRVRNMLSNMFTPIVLILVGLMFYANIIYPYISAVYGGGNRAPAMLFLTPRGNEVCKALSLPINENQTVGPLEILTESEKELTILVRNGLSDKRVAIQLNKDLLEAIQTKTNAHFSSFSEMWPFNK